MAEAGQALLGIGMGTGEHRAMDAVEHGIESPLLETSLEGARSILLSVTGGRDLSLWEVNEAAKAVAEAAHPEANIIFGAMIDEKIEDQVWVTVVATGYGDRPVHRAAPRGDSSEARIPADAEPRVRRGRDRSSSILADIDVPEFIPGERSGHDAWTASSRPAVGTTAGGNSHARRRCRRSSADGRGRSRRAARRRQRRRCRGGVRADVVRGRVAADRARRRRLHARAHGARARTTCSTSSWPRRVAGSTTASRRRSRRSTSTSPTTRSSASTSGRRRAAPTARRSGSPRRSSASGRWRLRDLTARSGAGRPRRRGGRADAGVPVHGARADHALDARVLASCTRRAGRCSRRASGFAFPSSATCSTGSAPRARASSTRATSPRRSATGCSSAAVCSRATTCPRTRWSSASRRASPTAGARGAHQPSALLGRDPDRGRARDPRAPRPPARPVGDRGGDRLHQPRTRRGVPRGAGQRGLPGALPAQGRPGRGGHRRALAARQHDPHRGDGRRGRVRHASPARTARARAWWCRAPACTSTTCSARRTSIRSAIHLHEPGARVPSMMAPDRGPARRAPGDRARQRRLEPDPLGHPADDPRRGRSRPARGGGGHPAAHPRGGARGRCRARASTPTRSTGLEESSWTVRRWSEQNLFFGGVQAVARNLETGELSGGGDPRRGGAARVV